MTAAAAAVIFGADYQTPNVTCLSAGSDTGSRDSSSSGGQLRVELASVQAKVERGAERLQRIQVSWGVVGFRAYGFRA